MNADLKENLLISCVSSEPYSTLILNPISGSTIWGFKSAQGGIVSFAEPLGRNAKQLIIPINNKPIIYVTMLNKKMNGVSVRSILGGIVNCLVSHPTGEFIFASIENKIYTWMSSNGELLSIVEDNLQNITCLKLSTCGYYLAAAFIDGTIKIYLTPELISERDHEIDKIKPFLTKSAHSLAVTDIYLTSGINPRILSVSLDHTIVFYSFCVDKPLLKITADYPITACCMDPAETVFILGTKNGKICLLDLFAHTKKEDSFINISGSKTNESTLTNEIRLFEQHTDEITAVCVNFDATLLASSDASGIYCIWDISNGQCLRTSTMKGKISTLKFVENWPILNLTEDKCQKIIKNNEKNLNQFKFQQNFSSIVTNNIFHYNFPETESEKDANLIEEFDEILNLISNNNNQLNIFEDKNSRKRLKIDSENNCSLNNINNLNDSNNNANNNINDKTDDIIEINSHLTNGNNSKETDDSKKIHMLEKEVKRLMMINQELYEFAANLVTEHGSCIL